MIRIAAAFGRSLDKDEYEKTAQLLSDDCSYKIGETTLNGPKEICDSYEGNMIEGRKKMDKLEWGESRIEVIDDQNYFVHFTDYLTHKGVKYTHRCKQKLTIKGEKIIRIEHIMDAEEQERLDAYYRSVGIK